MATDAGARPEGHEPEWLGCGGVNDLPHVEAHPLAQERKLVDERDVDVAKDILEQLCELGGIRRREPDHPVVDVAQEGRRTRGPGWREATDEARNVTRSAGRITGVDALWGKSEIEVASGHQAGALQLTPERTARRPRVSGRLEDDQLSAAQSLGDEPGRGQDGLQVRVLGLADRRGYADDDGRRRRHVRVPGARNGQAGGKRARQPIVGDVIDRGSTLAQLRDTCLTGVDPLDGKSGLDECDRERQADVTESDDGELAVCAVTVSAHDASRRARSALSSRKGSSQENRVARRDASNARLRLSLIRSQGATAATHSGPCSALD